MSDSLKPVYGDQKCKECGRSTGCAGCDTCTECLRKMLAGTGLELR